MSSKTDFSKIEDQRGFSSLLDSAECRKIPNSNLLICQDPEICKFAVEAIAKKVLCVENLAVCADFWQICPTGPMAQISVDQIRDVCAEIYLSPKTCPSKVVAVYGAECLHPAAANAFLKTLEAPPNDTIIVLTAQKLHAILPTIAGRCSITRLPSSGDFEASGDVKNWLANYSAWLGTLFDPACDEKNAAIMRMYLLLTQLEKLVETMVTESVKIDGEQPGKRGIYGTLLFRIENETEEFFRKNTEYVKFFPKTIMILEQKAKLIALNVNFISCIEAFLVEILLLIVNMRR
jgi:hypothetical protein